jgi:hypothetical protein
MFDFEEKRNDSKNILDFSFSERREIGHIWIKGDGSPKEEIE